MDPMSPFKLSSFDDSPMGGLDRPASALPQDPFLPSGRGSGRVLVLGHRGARGPERPDNSVAAVTEALLQGADGIEIDVRLTTDGTLVCAHDALALTRTGGRREVATSASGELLDTGGRNALATLPELLAAVQSAPGTHVVVEAKPVTDRARMQPTADAVAAALATYAGNAVITVSSFDADLLAMIRAACADLPVRTALLAETSDAADAIVARAAEDGHDEVHLPLVGLLRTPEAAATAYRHGLSVAVWGVNRRPELEWVASLGVDAVITDDILTAWSELDRAVAVREMVAA
jgi:glycerophosphoryl diester phosphodiesterase